MAIFLGLIFIFETVALDASATKLGSDSKVSQARIIMYF